MTDNKFSIKIANKYKKKSFKSEVLEILSNYH
jgi:hypothetical protein